jgi:hypothetical protein
LLTSSDFGIRVFPVRRPCNLLWLFRSHNLQAG